MTGVKRRLARHELQPHAFPVSDMHDINIYIYIALPSTTVLSLNQSTLLHVYHVSTFRLVVCFAICKIYTCQSKKDRVKEQVLKNIKKQYIKKTMPSSY